VRVDSFTWSLVAIYGTTRDEFKPIFSRELVNLANDNLYPILIGEDFNLLRFRYEKSKDCFDSHWPFLFNNAIVQDVASLCYNFFLLGFDSDWKSKQSTETLFHRRT
jgi:hypothetical protein